LPNHPGKVGYLTSAKGKWGAVVFKYHMFGLSMGSLFLEARAPGGDWEVYWQQDGALQIRSSEDWATCYLNFETVLEQVRFTAVTGSSYYSDIAVGDVILKHGRVALPVLGPYILASPRDALKNLCYSYCPETAQVAKSPCDRNDEAQNFMYDAEANTLLHNDQCLGVERHSNRGFKGLALMECPQSREEDFIWSCTGARCCVQSNPSICTNLRNGGPEMKKEWTIQGPG
jgi:hypothetical protein